MPGLSGIETLKRIRAIDAENYIAVIFVTGRSDKQDIIDGLDSGADDYIVKPLDFDELVARIRAKLRIKDLHDELRATTKKLEQLTEIDDLTGLFNTRSLYKKMAIELERARRFSKWVSCIMLDLDHFKDINDQNDHLFGSWVLTEVAKIIHESVRTIDVPVRYGGDEFLILLPETDPAGADLVALRIKAAIQGRLFSNSGQSTRLTCSMGVASLNAQKTAMDAKEFLRAADQMLYEAKESGRNCIRSKVL